MLFSAFRQASIACLLCLVTGVAVHARPPKEPVEAHLYRYKDAEGNLHIGRQIPPENYKYGYTALDAFGEVIEVVPPAPTKEERAAYEAEVRRKQHESVQRERDEQLLRAYSSASGAINARDRKLAQLDVMIDITRAKLAAMRVNYDREVEHAADMERAGKVPDRITLQNMADIEESMIEMESHIAEKEQEKEAVMEEFDPIISRLKEIEAERNGASENLAEPSDQEAAEGESTAEDGSSAQAASTDELAADQHSEASVGSKRN